MSAVIDYIRETRRLKATQAALRASQDSIMGWHNRDLPAPAEFMAVNRAALKDNRVAVRDQSRAFDRMLKRLIAVVMVAAASVVVWMVWHTP